MRSEYLEWVKNRKIARFNLAPSGVLPCSLSELGVKIDDLEINGPTLYGYTPLQEVIAVHCSVPAACVVAASGTSMANFLAMAVLVRRGDEVFIERPAYEPLVAAARYLGADVKRFPRDADPDAVVTPKTKLVVVTNLHNPSCALMDEAQLKRLAERAAAVGAYVLVDEVYLECMYEEKRSAFHYAANIVCTGSLTKAYGLGGLRCGWILAQKDVARRIWEFKDLIDPSAPHPAELLSVIAFRKLDRLARRAKAILDGNRALLAEWVHSCPAVELSVPPYGTCAFPRVKVADTAHFFETLHDRYETDVVPGKFFEAEDHFRMGIGVDPGVFAEGLTRLHAALRDIQ